jgi:hypothetical protein
MEEKLRDIVTRIDSAKLDSIDKDALYKTLAAGLRAIALPAFIKHMPKEELKDLADNPAKVSVQSYLKLLDDSIADGQALAEIESAMNTLLKEVDKTLKASGV